MLHLSKRRFCSDNRGQLFSPTAIRLAILLAHQSLDRELCQLADQLERKGTEFASIVELGRIQLLGALPMTLVQELEPLRQQCGRTS